MANLGFCLRECFNSNYCSALLKHLYPLSASAFGRHVQQVRHKGIQRFKQPPAAKEKAKWQPKKKVMEEEVMSPKELKEFMERVPQDDVWIQKYYPPAKYTFEQAILMHQELAAPEMQDNMDGYVYFEADLDLSTRKKTKFLGVVKGTVLLPNNFDVGVQSRVIVITKTEEDKEKAVKLGAVFVGGMDLIRQIEKGEIRQDDFDHVVLNLDMLVESALIKKTLKDRFPAKKKGNLGPDTEAMVQLFVNGRSFESTKISDAVGKLSFAFGKLNMGMEELKENLKAVAEAVSAQKPPDIGGPIFSSIRITCPPSGETFLLEDDTILPAAAAKSKRSTAAEEKAAEEKEEPQEEVEEEVEETAKN